MKTPRRLPLPACCAALFALAGPVAAAATTWPVTNCNDSGPGSLRAVIDAPTTLSGDTVDLTGLGCSTITLTTGAIVVGQTSLTLHDGGSHTRITGYDSVGGTTENARIFTHTGTGTLALQYLDVEYGAPFDSDHIVRGGCIYSAGNVVLAHASVSSCWARSQTAPAYGGGIYAKGNVTAKYSRIAGNYADGLDDGGGGGGIYARGFVDLANATVADNIAANVTGGVFAGTGASIGSSTISGNRAKSIGGLWVGEVATTGTLTISNSTISGNRTGGTGFGAGVVGGVLSYVPTTVRNSTVAFNTAATTQGFLTSDPFAPGLVVGTKASSPTAIGVSLQSSILSNNTTFAGSEGDFSTVTTSGHAIVLNSSDSIVRVSLGSSQAATVSVLCPRLGPLQFNGGLTQTHKLLSGSPAIGAGNNDAGLAYDQRGAGYPRMSGHTVDIGAYEVDLADEIFDASFEGCPVLE